MRREAGMAENIFIPSGLDAAESEPLEEGLQELRAALLLLPDSRSPMVDSLKAKLKEAVLAIEEEITRRGEELPQSLPPSFIPH